MKKILGLFTLIFSVVILTSCSNTMTNTKSSNSNTDETTSGILKKLVDYTNNSSAGPTKNYYWENGHAQLSGFDSLNPGETAFQADDHGRSGVARAVLTYKQYADSKGERQGDPLDPPGWPSTNPKVSINFSLTGKTYNGYEYNRSHSIADSLLGKKSYSSTYNFTTGTRSQNVGADQNGGMRRAEELAENYWKSHANTSVTIQYQTTPLYNGDEKIPRGSIVDIKTSDGSLDTEIVVINSAEGIKVDYNLGTSIKASAISFQSKVPAPLNLPTSSATGGRLYDSDLFYSQVTNPNNYTYMA